MARGPTKPLDERIAELDGRIRGYQEKIAQLNAKKKALIAAEKKAEMHALYRAVKDSGQSPAELLAKLQP